MNKISIVTAFFDIGRGNISTIDYPSNLYRTNDTYFKYFSYLASLNNEMIIFTSKEFEKKILDIRRNKKTKVIVFDFHNKLNFLREKIDDIQNNSEFIEKINIEQRKNIEYWSSNYVLVTNMKVYFINQAITQNLISNRQVAWIDFGYVRDMDTLYNIQEWQYSFNPNKIHFFSTSKEIKSIANFEKVSDIIFNNKVVIIGGCTVASQEKWKDFLILLYQCQRELLSKNIVDDDQGLYIMCLWKNPDLFQIHYLGKNKWFDLFKKYDNTSKIGIIRKIKDYFGW